MRIVSVVGARPQFIKEAAVSRALRAKPGVREFLVHTGQHYDANMSDVFFENLGMPAPDRNLGVGSGTHGVQTGQMLEAVERVLIDERPDWVLVYGDTNSTLAGALAAAKLHIPVAHVEAGLRSFNRRMPEEINRVLADRVADLLFAPTETAVANLRAEGIAERAIRLVGDVMYDAVLAFSTAAEAKSRIVEDLGLAHRGYVLATIHRAETTDDPARLAAVVEGLVEVAADCPVILPLHPRTRAALQRTGLAERAAALRLVEPVDYLDMLLLQRHAALVVTDSGGLQKEAFFHRVPCVTLRTETEWVELVEIGWNQLVPPTDGAAVAAGLRATLSAPLPAEPAGDLYGGGHASEAIVRELTETRGAS